MITYQMKLRLNKFEIAKREIESDRFIVNNIKLHFQWNNKIPIQNYTHN